MLNQQEARERVLKYLNKSYHNSNDEIVILDKHTVERAYGWIFFYQSKKFIQTENISYMLIGNGPIVIEKIDGKTHCLGSGYYKLEDEIRDFEIRRFGKPVDDETEEGC